VKFLTTFDDFARGPLPAASVAEYRTYLSRSMPFVRARNQRIHGYAASELHDRTCTWRPVNCQSALAFRSCCTAHISAPRLSAAYDSPAMASPRPGFEHEVTAGTPGNVAIPLCSAPFWPPGGCQDRPGSSPHPARRTIRRQCLLIARDQGDAARPRGPGRDPAALGPDRAPQTPRLRRRTTPALRLTGLQGPQRHRALVQRRQAVVRTRHALRQSRQHLSRSRRPTRHHDLAPRIGRHVLVLQPHLWRCAATCVMAPSGTGLVSAAPG